MVDRQFGNRAAGVRRLGRLGKGWNVSGVEIPNHAVVTFRRPAFIFYAQTKAKGQLTRNAPGVLHEGSVVRGMSCIVIIGGDAAATRNSQEKSRHAEAQVASRREAIVAAANVVLIERKVTGGIATAAARTELVAVVKGHPKRVVPADKRALDLGRHLTRPGGSAEATWANRGIAANRQLRQLRQIASLLVQIGGQANRRGLVFARLRLNTELTELIHGQIYIPQRGGRLGVNQVDIAALVIPH